MSIGFISSADAGAATAQAAHDRTAGTRNEAILVFASIDASSKLGTRRRAGTRSFERTTRAPACPGRLGMRGVQAVLEPPALGPGPALDHATAGNQGSKCSVDLSFSLGLAVRHPRRRSVEVGLAVGRPRDVAGRPVRPLRRSGGGEGRADRDNA